MPELTIGVQLSSLRQPFKKALHTAAMLGADAVEIDGRQGLNPQEMTDSAVRHVRKMLDQLNLSVCAVGFPTRRGYNTLEDLDRRVEATKQAMRMAYELGANLIVNHVGWIPDDRESEEFQMLVEVLSDLGRHGQRVGARLAAELGATDPENMAALLAELPEASVAVSLDPGELIIHGHSAHDAVRRLGPDVAYVYARDGVRDLSRGRGLETPLGRGSVDFPDVIGALENQAYRGAYTVRRDSSPDPAAEIGRAIAYLREM